MKAQPVQKELTEREFIEVLDDIYGDVKICGMDYSSGQALLELDPIAFRCAKIDYEDGLDPDTWECDKCGSEFDDEDDAEHCCMTECADCGEWFETESDYILCTDCRELEKNNE